jgi:uncharacterized membrane protein YhaH (DUF805 family)
MLIDGFGGIFAFFLLLSIVLFVVHIAICVWGYRDAIRKGKSQEFALIVLLGLLFFPVMGFIIYLLIRNDDGPRKYDRF